MIDKMSPLVTIVTASYKKFEHIYETIKSVIDQDYSNIEYIIADDGSPNFPENNIVDYIKQNAPRLNYKIYHSNINRGTVKNINYAFKNSEGDYIFPLSCGDSFFSKDIVSRIVDRFSTTKAKLIVTTRLFHDNYKPICLLPHYYDRKKIENFDTNQKQYEAFITRRFYAMASGSVMYYTRELLEELNYFDEKYVLWEDGPFLAKYLQKYPLTFAYDIISIWYEYGGMSTNKKQKNQLLLADDILFDRTERLMHIDELESKNYVKFWYELSLCTCKMDILKLKIKYPFVSLFYKSLNIRNKISIYLDKKILKKIVVPTKINN